LSHLTPDDIGIMLHVRTNKFSVVHGVSVQNQTKIHWVPQHRLYRLMSMSS